ncbi:Na+/H+ antiporter NhaA [Cellulosimicrobium terreum]|nr:Na+/H+ antiporter NhaA [Cellulosimicrobium terreum]
MRRAASSIVVDGRRAGALLLLLATVVAICWVNLSPDTYDAVWSTPLTLGAGDLHLDLTVHAAVNEALMAVFFFTVGLEVRRELVIGELTTRRRAVVPVVAAVAGMIVPAALFVLLARGTGQEHAWGIVISTDTAFLAGVLALVAPGAPGRLRTFLLALAVVDDVGALLVIALVYTDGFRPLPLLVAAVGLVGVYLVRFVRTGKGPLYATLAVLVWLGFLGSGVHPTLAGVAIALVIPVFRTSRRDVDEAMGLVHTFRQSPSSAYARAAANSLRESVSINERLQESYAPYVAYVILPLFALANAGVRLDAGILADAARSPVTWGVVVALVVGKLVGVLGASAALRVLRLGEFGPGLTLDRLAGGAALCGIGFTIALFITELAIDEPVAQNEARVGILVASVVASVLGAAIFRLSRAMRPPTEPGATLAREVDPARDHVAGRDDAPLTIVEYGDFECEFCLKASGSIDEVRRALGDRLRYVWRHAPRTTLHPHALAAAEASEAAALQGEFFGYLRSLFEDQGHEDTADLVRRAADLGLDVDRFEADRRSEQVAARVRDDVLDAEAMDVTGVPTFFLNGRRYTGPFDARALVRALETPQTDPHPAGTSTTRRRRPEPSHT